MEPLCSVAELETYLRRDVDSEAGALAVASASGIVRAYCRWHIAPMLTTTLILDGDGGQLLSLPTLRLTDVTEVRVDGVPLDPDDFTFSERGHLFRAGGWPKRFRCVDMACTHGWEKTPDAVRAVVLALAADTVVNQEPGRARSETVGAVTTTYAVDPPHANLSELQLALVAGYRLP